MILTRENVLAKTSIKNCNGFHFNELANIPKINLRGNSNDKNFIINVEKILDVHIPIKSNTFNSTNKLKIIWLGPDEWLIEIYETKDFDKIFVDLKNSLNSQNTAITDVSDNRTILKLQGQNLYKLLSKFVIIDLDIAFNKESSVAQTIFIKVPVLMVRNHKYNENHDLSLHANRSHAQYMINLLIDGS